MSDGVRSIESSSASERPLVTFALFAYNQEKFIREAVEGAFAQDYSPLEIILSDDCSKDRTFDIMCEMTENYFGKATLRVNRNEQNMGLAGHVNHVMKLAKGELIVVAAGDDVSFRNRVSEIVRFYVQHDKPDSIFSDYLDIDMLGNELLQRFEQPPHEQSIDEFLEQPRIKGAAHAWTKRIFDIFGPLNHDVLCEDQVIPLRAYLLRRPRYLDMRLIKYRRIESKSVRAEYFLKHYQRELTSKLQYLKDIKQSGIDNPVLFSKIEMQAQLSRAQYELWSGGRLSGLLHWNRLRGLLGFRLCLLALSRRMLG